MNTDFGDQTQDAIPPSRTPPLTPKDILENPINEEFSGSDYTYVTATESPSESLSEEEESGSEINSGDGHSLKMAQVDDAASFDSGDSMVDDIFDEEYYDDPGEVIKFVRFLFRETHDKIEPHRDLVIVGKTSEDVAILADRADFMYDEDFFEGKTKLLVKQNINFVKPNHIGYEQCVNWMEEKNILLEEDTYMIDVKKKILEELRCIPKKLVGENDYKTR
jgi:hypothetical protein